MSKNFGLKSNITSLLKGICLTRNGTFHGFLNEIVTNSIDGKASYLIMLIHKKRIIFIDNSMGFNVEFLKTIGDSTKRPIDDENEKEKNNLPFGFRKDIRKINTGIGNEPNNEAIKKMNKKFRNHIDSRKNIERKTIGEKGMGIKSLYNAFNMRFYSHFSVFDSFWSINEKNDNNDEYSDKYNIEKFNFSIKNIPIEKGVLGTIIIFEPRLPMDEYIEKWDINFENTEKIYEEAKEYIKNNESNFPKEFTIVLGYNDDINPKNCKISENVGEFIVNEPFSLFNKLTELNDETLENENSIEEKIINLINEINEFNTPDNDGKYIFNNLENLEKYKNFSFYLLKNMTKVNEEEYFDLQNADLSFEDEYFKLYLNNQYIPLNIPLNSSTKFATLLGGFVIKDNNYLESIITDNRLKRLIRNGILIIKANGLNSTRSEILPFVQENIEKNILTYAKKILNTKFNNILEKAIRILKNNALNINELFTYEKITSYLNDTSTNKLTVCMELINHFCSTINYILECINGKEHEMNIVKDKFIMISEADFGDFLWGNLYNTSFYSDFLKESIIENEKIKKIIVSIYLENGNIIKKLSGSETIELKKTVVPKTIEEVFLTPSNEGLVIMNEKVLEIFSIFQKKN